MSQLLGEEKRDGTFRVSTLGGDNDDDIYIMMKCVIVCVSQKMITVGIIYQAERWRRKARR